MPVVSRFLGIVIRMYFDDHAPPHFHAFYGESEVIVRIEPVVRLAGRLPPRALALVVEWATLHQEELDRNWRLLEHNQAPEVVAGLE